LFSQLQMQDSKLSIRHLFWPSTLRMSQTQQRGHGLSDFGYTHGQTKHS